jgi:hypothetical protein
MRITIRVKPGSARPGVGGEHDGALVVRVSARAVDGKATEAALAAVAGSFGVRRSAVRLVSGASSRTKIVDIDADLCRGRHKQTTRSRSRRTTCVPFNSSRSSATCSLELNGTTPARKALPLNLTGRKFATSTGSARFG